MTAELFKLFSFIKCPLRFWTGISCPVCGMTRAYLSLLTLDIEGAWHYHPLFWMPPLIVLLLIVRDRISKRVCDIAMICCLVLLVGVYIIRLIWGDGSVVGIDLKEGMIYKTVDFIKEILK